MLCSHISEASHELDLVIVATNSDVRYKIIKEITNHAKGRFWILEKILFQDPIEYEMAKELFASNRENVWVNLAQRCWPLLERIRCEFSNDPDLGIEICGSQWGLATNAIHNADLARAIWHGDFVDTAAIDSVTDSKRAGFLEFTGVFSTFHNGRLVIRQTCYKNGNFPYTFIIKHPTFLISWSSATGELVERSIKSNWVPVRSVEVAPLQSLLTTNLARSILCGEGCSLPTYDVSAKVHLAVIDAFRHAVPDPHYRKGLLPIT